MKIRLLPVIRAVTTGTVNEHPDHVNGLLAYRRTAHADKIRMRFLSLHPCAETFYRNLCEVRVSAGIHIQKIMALADLYGNDAVIEAIQAVKQSMPSLQYLAYLVDGEYARVQDSRTLWRIKEAHFPLVKSMDQFDWSFPKVINRDMITDLFRMDFIQKKHNVILLGGVGVGKTHISLALGREACLRGHSVLFTTAIDIVNTLSAAQTNGRFKQELRRLTSKKLLIIDELGYLPIDKFGADSLFQVISQRYEQGSIF